MKKSFFALAISLIATTGFAQWNQNGNNISTGFLTLGNNTEMGDGKRHLTLLGSDKAKSYMNIHFNFNNRLSAFLHSTTPDGNSTDLLFYTAPQPNSYFERVRIKGNGNVGIGTADPQYKLDVNGDVRTANLQIYPQKQITMALHESFQYSGLSMGQYAMAWRDDPWDKGGYTLWLTGYGGVKFFTRGQSRMGITPTGNVGIGTDNPQYKLDVDGDIRTNKLILKNINPPGSLTSLSRIQYGGHSLIIGSEENNWAHNSLVIRPGGTPQGSLFSTLMMDVALKVGEYQRKVQIHTAGISYFNGGNVGIGTENPKNRLDVNGTIRAKEVKVELENWSDFVFDKDYKLPTLQEVEAHINEHKHLPDIPSEKQVKEEGVNLAEMQAKLLQKIEELTLYVIKQEKEIESLKKALSDKE